MLWIINGEASKGCKTGDYDIEQSKTMEIYSLMRRFHHGHWIQVYKYDFMYAVPKTMSEEGYFTDTITCVENSKKRSTLGPVPKLWLGFSDIRLEDYELDHNFDDT